MLRFLLTVIAVSLFGGLVPVAGQTPAAPQVSAKRAQVVVIPVRDTIADPVLFVIRRGLKEAERNKVDAVVLDMNTPGGNAKTALEIMEALGKFDGDTITFVNKEAVSAGAFIAAASKEIWFAPQGVIGAAAAVTAGGQDIPETMRLKVNSFLSAKVRAATAGHGYRAQVVTAMMDKDEELKIGDVVIKKPGKLLSLTADEAMAHYGSPPKPLLGSGIAPDIAGLLNQKYGAEGYTVRHLEVTWSEHLAQYLTNLSPILLGLGLLALFIEFKTPGFGVFGIAGIVFLAAVFLSSYIAGLSGHEPILIFALGFVLFLVELLFFPGVVLPALLGIVLMLGSLVWAMADLWPNEPVTFSGGAFVQPLIDVGLGLVLAFVLALIVARFLPKSWFWDRLVLNSAVAAAAQVHGEAPEAASAADTLVGREGRAVTPLRPFGQVEVAGRRYEARLELGSADAGASVVVTGRTDFGLVVERKRS